MIHKLFKEHADAILIASAAVLIVVLGLLFSWTIRVVALELDKSLTTQKNDAAASEFKIDEARHILDERRAEAGE